jgi:PTS system fructose-specific IIA component/PTS system nitrogen regulatory IIA component
VPYVDAFRVYSLTEAKTKEQAIRMLVERLVAACGQLHFDQCDSLVQAILQRESLGSTGIGRGVAIPHAKWPGTERVIGAVGRIPAGIDFDSLDGKPVHVICLFVTPKDRPGESMRALEQLSKRLHGQH